MMVWGNQVFRSILKTVAFGLFFVSFIPNSNAQTNAQTSAQTTAQSTASFQHVITVVFENANYGDALSQPYFAQLAEQGALFTQFMAEAHPSQPNYIAMIAGDPLKVRSDAPANLDATHIGNLLEAKGLSWKVYAEDLPGNCYLGSSSGLYARKHVPFLSFTNVQKNAAECSKIVNANQFLQDVSSNALPTYSMYVPNLDHDGHNTGAGAASQWFSQTFGPLLSNPAFLKDTLVIITFDESESYLGKNQIYTVLLGANVVPGTKVSARVDHYSLLKLIEDTFGLGNLGRNDATAATVGNVFKNQFEESLAGSLATKPDGTKTPGVLCTPQDPNFHEYRYREHIPVCARNVSYDEKKQIAAEYGNIPESEWVNYEFDHLIPLSIGGSDDIKNLWPEPIAEAKVKDQLELQLFNEMNAGTITQAAAVQKIKDWINAH